MVEKPAFNLCAFTNRAMPTHRTADPRTMSKPFPMQPSGRLRSPDALRCECPHCGVHTMVVANGPTAGICPNCGAVGVVPIGVIPLGRITHL